MKYIPINKAILYRDRVLNSVFYEKGVEPVYIEAIRVESCRTSPGPEKMCDMCCSSYQQLGLYHRETGVFVYRQICRIYDKEELVFLPIELNIQSDGWCARRQEATFGTDRPDCGTI